MYLILSSAQVSFAGPSVVMFLVVAGSFDLSFTTSVEFVSLYNWRSFIGFHIWGSPFSNSLSCFTARVWFFWLLKKLSVGKESCGGWDFIARKTQWANISPIGLFFSRKCDDSQTYWSTLSVKLLVSNPREKFIWRYHIFLNRTFTKNDQLLSTTIKRSWKRHEASSWSFTLFSCLLLFSTFSERGTGYNACPRRGRCHSNLGILAPKSLVTWFRGYSRLRDTQIIVTADPQSVIARSLTWKGALMQSHTDWIQLSISHNDLLFNGLF